jgi:O-antigen ligase
MTGLPPASERLRRWSAHFLALTMAGAVLLLFVPRLWINPILFQSGLFLLAAGWAIALAIRPFELRFSPPSVLLACAAAWGGLQLAAGWTVGRADTRMAVLLWLGNLLAFLLASQVCASAPVRRRFLDTLLYFACVLCAVSVMQYFSWDGKVFWLFPAPGRAVLGPFLNRDQYAAFVEMVLPLALVRAMEAGSRPVRFAVFAAGLYASVIAGASRAGAILLTAEIVAVPLVLMAKGRMRRDHVRSAAIHVWALALVFAAVVGWAVLIGRFAEPDPLLGRRVMLSDTIAMIRARPFTGFGLGTFRTVYPAYSSFDFGSVVTHAHNDWAEWAADGGIPFGLLMVSIALWSIPKAVRTVWGVGLIAVFVHSLVEFPLAKPVLDLWLFALLGAIAAETARPPRRASGWADRLPILPSR